MAKRSASDDGSDGENPLGKNKEVGEEAEVKTKKPRTSTGASANAEAGSSSAGKLAVEKTSEGDECITLGRDLRRIVVREFKGKTLIDIRDFYTDKKSGDVKPGKGISLTPEQWDLLKNNVDVVDQMIKKK